MRAILIISICSLAYAIGAYSAGYSSWNPTIEMTTDLKVINSSYTEKYWDVGFAFDNEILKP